MSNLIHNNGDGVEFHEDRVNGSHRIVVRRPSSLSSDAYIDLPTSSGRLATEGYITNATGGTFIGLSADFTNTDATSTPEAITDWVFTVEANRTYYVEAALLHFDNAGFGNGNLTLTVPSGTEFTFYKLAVNPSTGATNSGSFRTADGEYQAIYTGNSFTNLSGIVVTSSTAGTVQLNLKNTAGDGTEQGFRRGSFIRIIDPQA